MCNFIQEVYRCSVSGCFTRTGVAEAVRDQSIFCTCPCCCGVGGPCCSRLRVTQYDGRANGFCDDHARLVSMQMKERNARSGGSGSGSKGGSGRTHRGAQMDQGESPAGGSSRPPYVIPQKRWSGIE